MTLDELKHYVSCHSYNMLMARMERHMLRQALEQPISRPGETRRRM